MTVSAEPVIYKTLWLFVYSSLHMIAMFRPSTVVEWYMQKDVLQNWPNAETALLPFPPGSNTMRVEREAAKTQSDKQKHVTDF